MRSFGYKIKIIHPSTQVNGKVFAVFFICYYFCIMVFICFI